MLLHKIKNLRESRNFSQDYVAKKLGTTQSHYSKIESGHQELSASILEKLLTILEIDINQLFDGGVVTNIQTQHNAQNLTAQIQHINSSHTAHVENLISVFTNTVDNMITNFNTTLQLRDKLISELLESQKE